MKAEREGRIVYYTDEHTDEFSAAQIKAIPIDGNYRYGSFTPMFRIIHFLYYRVFATPLALLYLKLAYHHRIINKREVLSRLPRGAVFIYGNHTNAAADAFIPTFVSFPRSAFIIAHANNVSVPFLGQSTKYLGAVPVPDGTAAARNFTRAIDERVKSAASICIYPEAHIWPFCTWIRDFPDVSFRYPVQYNAPVICFTNTYVWRGKKTAGKAAKVNMVTYVDGPFFPDKTLPPKERRRSLREAVHSTMVFRSGMSNALVVKYVKKEKI